MKRYLFFILPLLALTSCFQIYDDENDFRTVPVTNNPHVVPSHGSGMPGGAAAGPS
ncbi:MAG: membrane lipoprotein lipid attachment site-containing protein [Verrucomicrobia bacterium]|nr:membrane lipoprotein lipid attachment site-containing protein [Verrucomicrobiota bacterium]